VSHFLRSTWIVSVLSIAVLGGALLTYGKPAHAQAGGADLSVLQAFYTPNFPTTATGQFNVTVLNSGPDIAPLTVVAISGLDISLGLPAGCSGGGGDVVCVLGDVVKGGRGIPAITVPKCSVLNPAGVSVNSGAEDPNPANNSKYVPGVSIVDGCRAPGSGGGSGSGGSGGSGGTGGSVGTGGAEAVSPTATPSLSPMASVEASASTATAVLSATTAVVAPTPPRDPTGLPGWLLSGAVAAAVLGGGLLGWWWRRRSVR
jgi:hypothetical protein